MPLLKEQLALFNLNGREVPSLDPESHSFSVDGAEICIKKADCIAFLQSLPTSSVDLIVTDPAYSGMNNRLNLGRGRIVGKYDQKGTENGKWFEEFQDSEENYQLFLSECRRVLRNDVGHIYIMFDSYSLLTLGPLMREHFEVKNLITWDKVHIGMGHYFRRRHEYIIFATNGNNRKIRNQSFPDVWRFKRVYKTAYPTQKPVEIFQTMIYASSNPDFVVCDPFMGSGSSAIAAIKNKCNYLGCDIAAKAVEVTAERVDRYIQEGQDPFQKKSSALPDDKAFWEDA